MSTIYIVVDQYPRREVASFSSLGEAAQFMKSKADQLNLPIIVSRKQEANDGV
jgi:hypothetical protein